METALASIQSAARRALDPGVLMDVLAGGIGIGVTVIPEQFAERTFRGLFGNNGAGKGALTWSQLVARYGLYAAEIVAGLAVSEQGGAVGVAGEAMTAAAMWHAIRTTKTQFVGTGPVLGFNF